MITHTPIPETLSANAIEIDDCVTKLSRSQCRKRCSVLVLVVHKLSYERILIIQVTVWVDLLHDRIQMLERLAGIVDATIFVALVLLYLDRSNVEC